MQPNTEPFINSFYISYLNIVDIYELSYLTDKITIVNLNFDF